MALDLFERYKHNDFLCPVSSVFLEQLGMACGLSPASNVLDAACGKGEGCLILAQQFGCMVIGMEHRPEFAEEARRRILLSDMGHIVNVMDGAPDDLPFDEGFFDLAILNASPFSDCSAVLLELLAQVVRPGGWLAYSELVWRPDASRTAAPAVREWIESKCPAPICEVDARKASLGARGFEVVSADLSQESVWEEFYAGQARAILENRKEYQGSSGEQATLNEWQKELEIFHHEGGRQSLGYACFIMRRL
ncbi:MAG: class I SAM-dependent methyltransferase [bacterium]|nr:class I SAM-dependent methyltransferase [bacterium]